MKSLAIGLLLVGLTVSTITTTSTTGGGLGTNVGKRGVIEDYYNRGTGIARHSNIKEDTLNYNIQIDEGEIEELIEDFKDFGSRYISKTKAERILLMRKLKEAFKNTAAKMILNFGSTFPPLVDSWAQVMKHMQVNEGCDQECAVKCLDPLAGCENMYFNPSCLSTCKCKFDIERIEPSVIREKVDEVTKNAENVNRFFKGVNMENIKLLKPAFDTYMSKAAGLHEEFGELLKEHSAKVLGCDEECLEDCLDPNFVSFWEVPLCVKHCKCQNGLITIDKVGEDRGYLKRSHELDEKGFLEYLRRKNRGTTTLFGNVEGIENALGVGEEEEEEILGGGIMHRKEPLFHKKQDILEKSHKGKVRRTGDFNVPELMKYSDYDKKAWNFFKRYEEDIDY